MNLANLGAIALGITLVLMTVLFILRIVLTWYPQTNLEQLPLSLVALPTEPILKPMRRLIPPLGGVDITPIIAVGICTLLREILLGQQGLITMAMR
jgi:YggT family protein